MSKQKAGPTAAIAARTASYCPFGEASHLSGLSQDTLRRHHSDKIKKLSRAVSAWRSATH